MRLNIFKQTRVFIALGAFVAQTTSFAQDSGQCQNSAPPVSERTEAILDEAALILLGPKSPDDPFLGANYNQDALLKIAHLLVFPENKKIGKCETSKIRVITNEEVPINSRDRFKLVFEVTSDGKTQQVEFRSSEWGASMNPGPFSFLSERASILFSGRERKHTFHYHHVTHRLGRILVDQGDQRLLECEDPSVVDSF